MIGPAAGTAAVVGGASGLGAATARALHGAGYAVAVLDRDADGARAVSEELGQRAVCLTTDITDDGAVRSDLEDCARRGSLRAVVCCAGIGWAERLIGRGGPHDADAFARVIAVNVQGTFAVLRHAAALMAANEPDRHGQRGVCVLTSSIAAEDGQAGQIAYAASKAAIAGLVLPAARDLAPSAIRVCAIAPGVFDTPLLAALPEKARHALEHQVPWPPRLGDPAEFASLAVEICRNPMLNGTVLRLDGALRMPFSPPSSDAVKA